MDSGEDVEIEKFKHLLEHWIEHNAEHTAKYKEWTEKVREKMPEVSEILLRAIEKFEEGGFLLLEAKKLLDHY